MRQLISFGDALCCTSRVAVHYNFSKIIEVKADIKKEVLGITVCLWHYIAQSVTLLLKTAAGSILCSYCEAFLYAFSVLISATARMRGAEQEYLQTRAADMIKTGLASWLKQKRGDAEDVKPNSTV